MMKTPILLVSALGLSLAGCGGPLWKESKETIVEKPVVSQAAPREIIVEKPVAMTRSCVMGSSTFTHGSLSCQAGYQYRCDDGRWMNSGALC